MSDGIFSTFVDLLLQSDSEGLVFHPGKTYRFDHMYSSDSVTESDVSKKYNDDDN